MDARIVRTRHALQGALLELARDTPLDDITVGDITKRAHVNRSSFYLHYTDKDTLLADALEMQIDRSTGDENLRTDSPEHMPTGLTDYLNHVQEYASLYGRVLNDGGSGVVANRLRSHVHDIVERALNESDADPFPNLPRDIAAAGVAGLAVGIITAWLGRDPMPPVRTAATWIWDMLVPVAGVAGRPSDAASSRDDGSTENAASSDDGAGPNPATPSGGDSGYLALGLRRPTRKSSIPG